MQGRNIGLDIAVKAAGNNPQNLLALHSLKGRKNSTTSSVASDESGQSEWAVQPMNYDRDFRVTYTKTFKAVRPDAEEYDNTSFRQKKHIPASYRWKGSSHRVQRRDSDSYNPENLYTRTDTSQIIIQDGMRNAGLNLDSGRMNAPQPKIAFKSLARPSRRSRKQKQQAAFAEAKAKVEAASKQ
jgi:hypothetical protein